MPPTAGAWDMAPCTANSRADRRKDIPRGPAPKEPGAQAWRKPCACKCCCSLRPLHTDEVAVLQGRARGNAALGVVHHKLFDEVDAVGSDLGLGVADVLPALAGPLREGRLELRQVQQTRPLLNCRGAQLLEHLEDRVNLGIAGEERRPCGHLRNDASHAPNVDGHAVVRAAQEDLWGPVPHGDHLVRVLGHGHGVGPSQAEVGDLQAQPGVDEEVLGLEVSMQDSVGVAEIDAVTQLVGEELDSLGIQWAAQRLHVLLEVVLAELENEQQRRGGAEDVQQLDAFGCERAFVSDTSRMEVLGTPSSFDSLLSFIATTSPVLTFLALYTMA
mmetsp:Transcript_114445/g.363752  ORF Transcript_114445/g.363752 Transcript_114445/m.363752 type:complete len:330 (+) Transcript_114445:193-1182(+)